MKYLSLLKKKDASKILVICLLFSLILPLFSFVSQATDTVNSENMLNTDAVTIMPADPPPYYSPTRSEYGWIYGTVTDQDGNPVNRTSIIIYKSAAKVTDSYNSRHVTFSSETGFFRMVLLPGIYGIEAYKKGYSSEKEAGVRVEKGFGTKVDFVLTQSSAPTHGLGVLRGTVYGSSPQLTTSSGDGLYTSPQRVPLNSAQDDLFTSPLRIPLKGVQVSIYLLAFTPAAEITHVVDTCFTDGNGNYELLVAPGSYSVVARRGVSYQQEYISITDSRITELDFVLKIEKTAVAIDESISRGNFGAELSVRRDPNTHDVSVQLLTYEAITIEPLVVSSEELVIQVSGERAMPGKTIAITTDSAFELGPKVDVRYDGVSLNQADNLSDILDPTDDGIYPEYYIVQADDGTTQILVSIPHFSENSIIEILPLSETIGTIASLALYGTVLALVAVLYIAPMWYLRKK